MIYTDCIIEYIEKREYGDPIFIEQIAEELASKTGVTIEKAKRIVSVTIKRLMDSKKMPNLRRYQRGIYFRAAMTPFGETGINKQNRRVGQS